MTETKKARSDAPTSEQARDSIGKTNPYPDNSIPKSNMQGISALLSHGEANAIPARDLAKALGLSDTRILRTLIDRERCSGELILASQRGDFLPALDPAQKVIELRRYCKAMDARLRSNRHSVSAAKKELKSIIGNELDGQLMLDIGEDKSEVM